MRGFLLLATLVLAAIGAGVGVEAAAQPVVYGPPGARFTAAFPAPPTAAARRIRPPIFSLLTYAARGPSSQLYVTVMVEPGSGWTGYAPLGSGNALVFSLTKGGSPPPPRRLTLRTATLEGERVQLGAACPARASCIAVLSGLTRLDAGHLVQWSATAFARSPALARTLVTSLRPMSGTVPRLAR